MRPFLVHVNTLSAQRKRIVVDPYPWAEDLQILMQGQLEGTIS